MADHKRGCLLRIRMVFREGCSADWVVGDDVGMCRQGRENRKCGLDGRRSGARRRAGRFFARE